MFFIILAALLWGVTNPFLKLFTEGFASECTKNGTQFKIVDNRPGVSQKKISFTWVEDALFLLSRPKYLLAQGLNLLGSLAFFYGLRDVDVSVGGMVANSLALGITCAVSSLVLKEEKMTWRRMAGVFSVVVGVSTCAAAKSLRSE